MACIFLFSFLYVLSFAWFIWGINFFSGYLEDIILILLELLYMHNVNLFPLVKGEIKYNSSSSAYLCSQFITD